MQNFFVFPFVQNKLPADSRRAMSIQRCEDLRLHWAAMLKNPNQLRYLLEIGLRDFCKEGRRSKDMIFAGKTALDI